MRFSKSQYRGKQDKSSAIWKFGALYISKGQTFILGQEDYNDGKKYLVIPETVCEFSGIYSDTDFKSIDDIAKNDWLSEHSLKEWLGFPLYEGDIVKGYDCFSKKNEIYVIKYDKNGFYLYDGEILLHPDHIKNLRLCGNIFENPNYLTQKGKQTLLEFYRKLEGEETCHPGASYSVWD